MVRWGEWVEPTQVSFSFMIEVFNSESAKRRKRKTRKREIYCADRKCEGERLQAGSEGKIRCGAGKAPWRAVGAGEGVEGREIGQFLSAA